MKINNNREDDDDDDDENIKIVFIFLCVFNNFNQIKITK